MIRKGQLITRTRSSPSIGIVVVGLLVLGQALFFLRQAIEVLSAGDPFGFSYVLGSLLSFGVAYGLFVPRLIGFVGGLGSSGFWFVVVSVDPTFAPVHVDFPSYSIPATIVINVVLSLALTAVLVRNCDVFSPDD